MHDDVSPKQHRPLQRRRGKAVVQRQQGASVVGNIGQRLDIAHLGQGVGGGLGKQQPGVAAHGGLPGGGVGLRHKGGFHAKAGQVGANEADGGAEHRARAHDVVTGLEQGQAHHQNGGHARGGANGGIGTFQRGQTLLEAADGGVAVAAVGVAVFLAGKAARGGLG